MSMSPLDLQVSIPQSGEVSRINAAAQHRPETAMQQFANQLQKQVQQEKEQVNSTNHNEGVVVSREGKEHGQNGGEEENKDKKRRGASEEARKALEEFRGGALDIYV